MTEHENQFEHDRDADPALEPDLVEVDAMAGRALQSQPIPTGLADRVYAASVGELSHAGDETDLRLAGGGELPPVRTRSWIHSTGLRVGAIAATVTLAVFIGYQMWSPGVGVNGGGAIAELGSDIPFVPLEDAFNDDLERDMAALQDWMASASTSFDNTGLDWSGDRSTLDLYQSLDDLEESINSF